MGDERELIETYLDAFRAANGHERVTVRYARGWFSVGNERGALASKCRRAKLIEMTETLLSRPPTKGTDDE